MARGKSHRHDALPDGHGTIATGAETPRGGAEQGIGLHRIDRSSTVERLQRCR
jgi:hypothetical protein